jgi:oligopeptide transport system substrate-binding protein
MGPKKLLLFSLFVLLFVCMFPSCAAPEKLASSINLNLSAEPKLDPALASDSSSLAVVDGLFWGLTDLNSQTYEAIPKLATSWEVSKDGLVWTFHLRGDFYWVSHDPQTQKSEKKRQVTAHDVEYAVKRTVDPATRAPFAYVDYIIKNAQAVNTRKSSDLDAVGVQAVDDLTVQFTLERPAAYFPSIAGMWFNDPLPKEVMDQFGAKWTEPGSLWSCAPYLLDTWQHRDRLAQVKNPFFYDAKHVSIATVNWAIITDASAALSKYQAGELDSMADVAWADLERIHADPTLSKELRDVLYGDTGYISFNVSKPPLDNTLVRKALAAAYDKQELIDTVFKSDDMVAKTFAPPGIFGSPALDPNFAGIPYDPQQARQWLAEAGYPDGKGFPAITLMHVAEAELQPMMQSVQQQWKENLGIDVTLVSQEWNSYVRTLATNPPEAAFQMWAADYPDENNWVLEVFHPTKGGNEPRWSPDDPAAKRFMEVTEAAAAEVDPAKRKELYSEAEKILCMDEAIIVPLYHSVRMYLTKPYVERLYPVFGGLHIEGWKVRAH